MQLSINHPDTDTTFSIPGIVALGIDGYEDQIKELNDALDEPYQETMELANEALAMMLLALIDEDEAIGAIDEHCLEKLLEDGESSYLDSKQKLLVKFLFSLSMQLYAKLKEHKLYVDGKLPYRSMLVKPNGVYLKRHDLLLKEVQDELVWPKQNIT